MSETIGDHLVGLADGWCMWRSICVRGAGFPAREVRALAAPEAAEAADRLHEAEQRYLAARDGAIAACSAALEARTGDGKSLGAAIRYLRQNRMPPTPTIEPVTNALRAVMASRSERDDIHARFERDYSEGMLQISHHLRRQLRDPDFRKALLWTNRNFLLTACSALERRPPGTNDSRTRQHDLTLAAYLQRFSVKCDSISFFGPIGWASFAHETRVVPSTQLVAQRTAYLEYWCVRAIADVIEQDPELRPHLAPRLMPSMRLDGDVLHYPIAKQTTLPHAFAAVLAACTGDRTAREIGEHLAGDASLELSGVDEVYQILSELADQGLATWAIEIPTARYRPWDELRRILEPAPIGPRERGLALLERVTNRLAAVHAATEPDDLDGAIASLETTFSELTHSDATRNAGQMYAARSIVYEDCQRAGGIYIGDDVRNEIATSLLPLLSASRWYTYEIAASYRREMLRIFQAVAAEHGVERLDYVRFFSAIEHLMGNVGHDPAKLVRDVGDELRRRWLSIIGPLADQRVVVLDDTMIAKVRAAFAAPHPGWPIARHHSPDIMIAAASVDEIRAGNYQLVLGEVHCGMNTLTQSMFVEQAPDPDAIGRWVEQDMARPRVSFVMPAKEVMRGQNASVSSLDVELETGRSKAARSRERVISVGQLEVYEEGGNLWIEAVDKKLRFDAVAFFEHFLVIQSSADFTLLPSLPHVPRITFGKMVLGRERWTFMPADLAFAHAEQPSQRFYEAREWARGHKLPGKIFYKIPEEVKPYFVDFDSPILVEVFAKAARKASKVSISEMLPTPDEAWLVDGNGTKFVCELRTVAVDPQPWREPCDGA